MASVQCYGLENTLSWARNVQIPVWGLFDGRRLIAKYETSNLEESQQYLENLLSRLAEAEETGGLSIATYTLKFYEPEGKKAAKVSERADCNGGSFNFKLVSQAEYSAIQGARSRQFMGNQDSLIMQRLERIEARLSEPEPDDDDDEKPAGIMGALNDPNALREWVDTIHAIKGLFFPSAAKPVPATIGSAAADENTPGLSPDQSRLVAAINILETHDPKIVAHLEKLAQLAQKQPAFFNQILQMLEGMNV